MQQVEGRRSEAKGGEDHSRSKEKVNIFTSICTQQAMIVIESNSAMRDVQDQMIILC
jgi:hypothetical protein